MARNFTGCSSLTFFRSRTPERGKDGLPRGGWEWEIGKDSRADFGVTEFIYDRKLCAASKVIHYGISNLIEDMY